MNIQQNQLNFKCSNHQKNDIILIQVNQLEDNKHIFYCDLCMMYDKTYQSSNYVLIKQILEQVQNSHIMNWPPLDNVQLKEQIYKMQTEDKKQNQLECQINQYFEIFKTEIFSKIESCQKNMKRKAVEFQQFEDQIFKKIQECQKICQFKSILLNSEENINVKEKQCREFINQIQSQKSNYSQQLKQMFDNLIQNQQSIDFKTPNQIKQSIIKFIQNINFFYSLNHFNNQQTNTNQQDRQYNQNEQKADKIIELLSVKSNFLSDSFVDSIKQPLKQISPLIDQISINQMHSNNNKPIDFSKLSDIQMKAIRDLTEYYAEQQINSNLTEQVKQQNQFKLISQILNNKENQLEERFIGELEKYIIETYPLLKSINFNNYLKNNKQIEVLKNRKDENVFNKCQFIENKRQLQLQSNILFSNLQLIKSNYDQQNSKNLKMQKVENNSIQLISKENTYGTFYSSMILERNETYMFRFQFKIGKNENEGFTIGLVRDETKDQYSSFQDLLSFCILQSQNKYGYLSQWGIDKCIKGDLSDMKKINSIELRVCIKDGLLEVLDYPNYNHKYVLSDNQKNNLITYSNLRLAVSLQYNVELTLINAQICQQFQN